MMIMIMEFIAYSLLAFVTSFVLTKLLILLKVAVATPNARSSHTNPIPTGAGFGVLIAFMIFIFTAQNILSLPQSWHITSPILISALLLGLLGLADDIWSLPAVPRLFMQFCLATWVVLVNNFELQVVLPENTIIMGGYAQIIAIFWIVGFSNLYNFMDGADGMITLGTITVCLIIVLITSSPSIALIAVAMASSMIGFFPFNFPKARVFFGDCGSQSFGFLLACLLLTLHSSQPNRFSLFTMILSFMPYLYDSGMTTCLRLFRGNNILLPHREFIFHKMIDLGMSHKKVSLIYMISLLACGVGAVLSSHSYVLNQFIALLAGLLLCTTGRAIVINYQAQKNHHEHESPRHE